jgi:nascent polypeptide-associated complex subunit alpha
MIPGMSPGKMNALMKQMGIKQEEIDAERVVIEKKDGGNIVINNPSVVKINMQGNESFQITGDVSVESAEEGISEDDVKLVMEKTGKSEEEVREVLEKVGGDLSEAIMELS